MANDLTGNPLIIDTAGTTDLSEEVTGRANGRMKIVKVRWVGGTTATHHATIKDGAGRMVWDDIWEHASANFQAVDSDVNLWVRGLQVPVLGSGTLYVHLK